jgi:multisubunit Na+/H+ antiporter MnhB subunit
VAAVLLAFKRRGRATGVAEPPVRPLALGLSVAFATAVTALLLTAGASDFDASLSRWFAQQSVPAAQGRNVVNVILVDFRALDTLGEIAVVMLSLLAAAPMLQAVLAPREARDPTGRVVIRDVATRPLYWLILAVAVVVLLRGHNEPGGGFIGGLLAVTATVLWAVAHGTRAAARRLPLRSPMRLATAGVLLAAASGLPAWWYGDAFLTHRWGLLTLGPASLPVSTVVLFDAGVFLCVWGALAGYALALVDADPGARDDDSENAR